MTLGPNERPVAEKRIVSTNYFDVLGARMVQGRGFSADDRTGNDPVVVVNETFVRRYLTDGPVIGRQIEFLFEIEGSQRIVGVVADIKERDLNAPATAAVYIPVTQRSLSSAYLMVSVSGDPAAHVPAVRRAVLGIDPLLPLANVRSMDDVIRQRLSRQRFATTLLGSFSLLALLLAAIGVYGVISYTVAQRRAEMGVRSALGASSGAIIAMVMRQGITLVAAGVAMGVLGALGATRVLRAELFGAGPTDVVSFAAAALLLGAVAVAATAVPSWRAARVDPLTALRQD